MQKRFEVYGLKARLCLGNTVKLDSLVPAEPYDLIYSFGVIHHTPHPERVFEEIEKYCNPQTEIRVMLYSKVSWKVFWVILKYGKGAFWHADELVKTIQKHSLAALLPTITHSMTFVA